MQLDPIALAVECCGQRARCGRYPSEGMAELGLRWDWGQRLSGQRQGGAGGKGRALEENLNPATPGRVVR